MRERLTRAFVFGICATAAWLGWLAWYLVGLKLPVVPGHAANIDLRSLATPYVMDFRIVDPIFSGSGIRDIVATAIVVGVPVLLLGLWWRGGATRERRLALVFALPSLAFLVAWWPVQGVDMEMDLIFATFPAFFAGAWLCARTQGATVAALVLAALAHTGFWFVVRSGDFGENRAPVIHVRWVETLEEAQRATLERSLGLHDAEHRAGSTWRYRVPDLSRDGSDAVVSHDMVADSYGFDDAADARFGPMILVRWVETLGDAQRMALERSLGLYRAEHSDGSTWRYRLPEASQDRLRAIVNHEMVADTHGFDRASLELDAPAADVPRFTNHQVVYTSGWHPAEVDAAAPDLTWRWTRQTATLSFTNPHADAMFYLEYAARPRVFGGAPQTVTIRTGDQVLQTFSAESAGWRIRRIPLPAAALGTEDTAEMQIAVDRTFVPATLSSGGLDRRELGIQVYRAFVVLR